jgi:hypothetical protein
MITIEDLQNAEFPFRLTNNYHSFIITEFTSVEERDCSYFPENKSLFLVNCRYILNYHSDIIVNESCDYEIGKLNDSNIVKHDDIEFQSFFNRMELSQINNLQSLSGLSETVKKRLTPKVPYVIISADHNIRKFDFRESIVNKEYVHCEDDSMFIVDKLGFKGAANFKLENSNVFNESFVNFISFNNFIINVHDDYFPFYVFDKLKNWKSYNTIEKSLSFHFDKFKDIYNKIKTAGFPYIIEKLGSKEDLYVISRRGRDKKTYFKLSNIEENQDFFLTEDNDVYNRLEENIITHLDPRFTKYIFRLAHEHTSLAIPNSKLYLMYERKDDSPKKELPFAYYSEDNGNYIIFRKTDSGDYNAFDYKSDSYIVLSASTVNKMFEHINSGKNSTILNTSDLTKHHRHIISNFVDVTKIKSLKNTWDCTGIDLDNVLSNNEKDSFESVPEEPKDVSVEEFQKIIFEQNKKDNKDAIKDTYNLKELGTKQSEGKLNYELDFGFITQIAERMAQNKNKYEPYNWKKPIDVELLKQALFRHVIAVMNGKYDDDGREFGHLESIALDAKMINYQLKYNKQ